MESQTQTTQVTQYKEPISNIECPYSQLDDAVQAIQDHQSKEGFVCNIASQNRDPRTTDIIYTSLQCRQSGRYREWQHKAGKYKTSSFKTNCPFRARIKFNKYEKTFDLKILQYSHNHDRLESLLSSSALRLRSQKKFGLDKVLSIVESKSKGKELSAKQIAEQIGLEHPSILINGLDVFFFQRKLRLAVQQPEEI